MTTIPRKYSRVKTALLAQAKPSHRMMFESKVTSLGEGGAFLATTESLRVGSEIFLTLMLEIRGRSKSCLVPGKIVWINSDSSRGMLGCAIAFNDCAKVTLKLVRNFVASNLNSIKCYT